MNTPLVMHPGADLDLEILIQHALEESKACSTKDMTDDVGDIQDGLPVVRPGDVNTSNRSRQEPETEMKTERKITPYDLAALLT